MTEITTETVEFDAPSGRLRGYLAKPSGPGTHPAILVGMEAFGWADHILDVTRRFAQQGFVALMPDLYANDPVRQTLTVEQIEEVLPLSRLADPEPELAKYPPEKQEVLRRGLAWRKSSMTSPTYVPDFLAALAWLKRLPAVDPGHVALIGYCMGGYIVGEALAQGADVTAGVIYYGRLPDGQRAGEIRAPLQGHFGGTDTPITSTVPNFEAAMRAAGRPFEAFIYDGAPHAFFNDTRKSFHPEASALAWTRTLAFFDQHLRH